MALYLGPLGGLTRIHPQVGLDVTSERFGGVHQGLSGRRTVDYLGNRGAYVMTWQHLTGPDMALLEALHHRQIPGPLRLLLDTFKRNRLSRSAASVGYGNTDLSGLEVTSGYTRGATIWPPGVPLPGRSLAWSGWSTYTALRLDRQQPAPVLDGETVTGSIWVHASHADTVYLVLDDYGPGGYDQWGGTAAPEVTLTPNTWTRLAVTSTPPTGATGVSPAVVPTVQADPSSTLTLAAAQVEPGSAASGWEQGGGAPVVAVDQMPTVSPYGTYMNPELTLWEL